MTDTKSNTVKEQANQFINKMSNDYLVIRNLLGLSCFALAFGLFLSYAFVRGDLVKTAVALMGIVVMFLGSGLILEFILKTVALENNPNVKRFSALFSVNMILGLAVPLFIINMIMWGVVQLFSQITNYGTALCEIRQSFVRFYYYNGIFFTVNEFIKLVVVTSFFVFVFGALVERYWKK
ncbi:MAG: hypothetical protein ABI721_04965 [Candidatus Dojkabacteria bacterium]